MLDSIQHLSLTHLFAKNSKLNSNGPLLITHKGLSAPSILKLSAFGALEFALLDHKFSIEINFLVNQYLIGT